jgi:hypothetical protein
MPLALDPLRHDPVGIDHCLEHRLDSAGVPVGVGLGPFASKVHFAGDCPSETLIWHVILSAIILDYSGATEPYFVSSKILFTISVS